MSENLLTILPELTVTSEEVRQAEDLAQQYLSALYPTVDFRPGLAIYDQVIRPGATLIALANKGIEVYFANNTKDGVTDETPEDFVDKLMSNHFLSRIEGSVSTVVARLYFLQKKNVFLSSSYYFSTNNEQFFYPPDNLSISATDMLDSGGNSDALAPYYIDVELEAESPGKEYDIEAGGLLFFSTFDPFFVGGEILYLKESTITKETNTEFVARTEASVSTRNLINNPSIIERMTSTFNYVNSIQPIGHSDPEMIRDIRYVTNPNGGSVSELHMGGMVDVYVDAPLLQSSQILVKLEEVDGQTGFYIDGPIILYEPAVTPPTVEEDLDPENGYVESIPAGSTLSWNRFNSPIIPVGYEPDGTLTDGDYSGDTGFSVYQRSFVPIVSSNATLSTGGTVEMVPGLYFYVNVTQFMGLTSIQAYLDDVSTRVIAADYMARAMDVYLLDFTVNTFGGVEISADTIRPYIEDYIKSLGPDDTFVMADLVCILNEDAGVDNLSIPLTVSYLRITRNGQTETGTIVDAKDIDRLSRFWVNTVTTGTIVVPETSIGAPL